MGWLSINKCGEWLSEETDGRPVAAGEEGSLAVIAQEDFGHKVALSVETKESEFGLLMCGTGNGINITANKHKGIRSALCWNREVAKLARQHNAANILTLPARFIDVEEAKACVDVFFTTSFDGGRHALRIKKISAG